MAQILNIDKLVDQMNDAEEPVNAKNHYLFPQHEGHQGGYRWMVTGPSGTGKTNLVISSLLQTQIKFDHLWLVVRSPNQPKYVLLLKWINSLERAFKEKTGEDVSMVTVITAPEDLPPLEDLEKSINNLVLIDDMVMASNQDVFEDYFVRSRHYGTSLIYLTQDYYKVPIIIRRQCNYISIFGVNSKQELDLVTREHSLTYDKKEFKLIFKEATAEPNSFLFIDRRTELDLLKLRKGFDQYWDEDRQSFVPIEEEMENILN